MGILAIVTQADPGELFGWVEAVFVQLGVWTYIQAIVALSVIIGGVKIVQHMLGR